MPVDWPLQILRGCTSCHTGRRHERRSCPAEGVEHHDKSDEYDGSSAARHTRSSGTPVLTLRRAGSPADTAWLMAAVMKIRKDAPPASARLCTAPLRR
jgi:hypothetical protein